MKDAENIAEIGRYESQLAGILSRHTRDHHGIQIGQGGDCEENPSTSLTVLAATSSRIAWTSPAYVGD